MRNDVLVLLVMAAVPFVAYLTIKLGTYAFYRGRQLFEQDQKKGKHGNEA